MLPAIRQNEYLYKIPRFDLNRSDIENFADELTEFHKNFQDCFHRIESRRHFYRYMTGQFSGLERKSIEPIALSVEGGNVRAMQRFISDAEWADEKIESRYRKMVSEELGSPDGAILFDESGFLKKGSESIGVARQYCGNVGKVDNCQIGVFAAYASSKGYALLDKKLYLPQKWFEVDYRKKWEKCNLPEETEFKTKPQLAASMLDKLWQEGRVPFKYVLADSIYGENSDFIDAAESINDITYFVSIGSDTHCWLKKQVFLEKQYTCKGNVKSRTILKEREERHMPVKMLAKDSNGGFWHRRKVSEGTKGTIEYEFAKHRIILSRNGLPDRTVWLIIKRTLSDAPEYSYYISNAPVTTRLKTFVWLSGIRWAIEQCFEETKSELGMDHYEVRKFTGRHHHILVCMLAHFFLWHMKIKLGKKSTIYYFVPD
ncbi:MAG: IS701 family transposase [Desulfamplus sp.]|nr:IS701 family transposase [Desulfamplus sp.]